MNRIYFKITGYLILLSLLSSCYKRDWEFPDFDHTATYFPYQYPIRTLVLGDYIFDNSNDQELKFLISATMGGVYENKKDILIDFEIDESLAENLYMGEKKLKMLPSEYFTLSDPSQMLIPKGELFGGVEIQLTEAFLNDSNAIGFEGTTYVLPLRITSATTDSVLFGMPAVADADVRIASEWIEQPRNFTLYGINYVNEYHGNYLKRGRSEVVENGNVIETNVYRNKYVERDEVVQVLTASRNTVKYRNRVVRDTSTSPGNFEMIISFENNNTGTLKETSESDFTVSGSAKFVRESEAWGSKPRSAIYLEYEVDDGTYIHKGNDTLVFRDKGVTFQDFLPEVKTE